MKYLLILLAFLSFSAFADSPKFAKGDEVYLKDLGFYRNCQFPAFVEMISSTEKELTYSIAFKCPSRNGGMQVEMIWVKESELLLATAHKFIFPKEE